MQALEPVNPDSVSILRSSASERLVYEYTDRHGKLQRLTADEMLHIRYHTEDGARAQPYPGGQGYPGAGAG